ncbi:MAG: CoA-binding protein [Ignavibacteria bacterium]|nr:CoA-binding protein [Ignavibacteria bacterium]
MTEQKNIEKFFEQKDIAVFGVSRSGKKFGNTILKDLRTKGWNVYPVNPNADEIEGNKCYKETDNLPEEVSAAVLCIKPEETEKTVIHLHRKGITDIWIQQGAESAEAIKYCEENGMNCIYDQCVMMFAEPVNSIHKFHRWINKITGKLPK